MDWLTRFETLARKLALASGENPDRLIQDGCWSHFGRFDGVAQHRRWLPIEHPAWHRYVPLAARLSDSLKAAA